MTRRYDDSTVIAMVGGLYMALKMHLPKEAFDKLFDDLTKGLPLSCLELLRDSVGHLAELAEQELGLQ